MEGRSGGSGGDEEVGELVRVAEGVGDGGTVPNVPIGMLGDNDGCAVGIKTTVVVGAWIDGIEELINVGERDDEFDNNKIGGESAGGRVCHHQTELELEVGTNEGILDSGSAGTNVGDRLGVVSG
jgi:hypothetical protein